MKIKNKFISFVNVDNYFFVFINNLAIINYLLKIKNKIEITVVGKGLEVS